MGNLLFRVLGPVEVISGGHVLPLGRGTLTDLLAALIMSPNQAVSAQTLAETVWYARPPAHPRPALQSAVARLRRVIGGGFIETLPSAYRFRAEADDLDLLRFEQLSAAADMRQAPRDALAVMTRAIDLWHGTPLENVGSPALVNGAVPRLTQLYLNACEKWGGLCLQTGQHDAVVARLTTLVDAHPFRERMAELLILALYRSGRQGDAIAAYEALRRGLSEELGIDPGQSLRETHLKILRADPSLLGDPYQVSGAQPAGSGAERDAPAQPPSPPAVEADGASAGGVPHRLPADTRVFTGRQSELARLVDLAAAANGAPGTGAVVILAIDGMAGIGKTALAVHAAHQLAGRFGDGQLFIDLHGYTEGYPPRTANQALEIFLRTLGVPPQQVPDDAEERAALYRERLAGSRTLIVLDNAADEAQVRPLIPGEPGCLVLVTSRRKLKGLDDAHTLALDVLPEPEAIALFCAITWPGRVMPGDPAVAEIAGLCGRLPLAVRIAAALLRSRPAWTPGLLAGRLRAARSGLGAFHDGDRDLAAVFDLSSRALPNDHGRLYRYLGLIPGAEIDAYATAALLNVDPVAAEHLLQALVDQSLLLEPAPGRYWMHDLIRAHARAQSASAPAQEREAALGRLLDYYQHTAARADARLARYDRPEPASPAPAHAPALPDATMARAWLRAERASLTACLQYAVDTSRDERTVALSESLATLLRSDGPWPQAAAAHTAAAAAAARLGDRSGQAHALHELGSLRRLTADYPAADRSLQAALVLYEEEGNKPGLACTLAELGIVRRLSCDFPGAERYLQRALELSGQAGHTFGRARALAELGIGRHTSGDFPGAQRYLQAALELYQQEGDRSGQARALTELAEAQELTGDYEGAIRNGQAALDICEALGDRLGQANALTVLGKMRRRTGDYDSAARDQQAALQVYRELGDRLGQANARTLLAEVRGLAGDYEGAARDLRETISTFRDLGIPGNQAWALNRYAAVISLAGDPVRAIALYRDALHLARDAQQPDDEAAALHGLGESHLRCGELRDGAACLHQALQLYRQLGMPVAEEVTARLAGIEAPG